MKFNKNPLVSVVMITYNHAPFILQAIEGVLFQKTNFEVEFIIADDCSPDDTETIIQKYLSHHPKGYLIKYTKHNPNKGMMPNFIWALEKASGKYIALCEGDDYWIDPNKLQKQVDYLEVNPSCQFVFHRVFELQNGNMVLDELNQQKQENFLLNDVLHNNYAHTPSIVMRAPKINQFPSFFETAMPGDHTLQILLLKNGGYAHYMTEPMAVYRRHDGGVWSSDNGDKYAFEKAITKIHINHFLNLKDKQLQMAPYFTMADYVILNGYSRKSRFAYLKILFKNLHLFELINPKNFYLIFPLTHNFFSKLIK